MKEHVREIIQQIELDYDVKVLYACESGSRAWGFPTTHSDYDVRFIYVHKKNWYLSIDQQRDVIEIPKHDTISIPIHDLLDISGWELTKALRLLRKSNPPLLEWLGSSIVYYPAFSTILEMKALSVDIFSPNTCLYHYLSMAKGNFRDCLKDKQLKVKKYINVFRPLLAAKWIEENNSIPPTEFQTLFNGVDQEVEMKNSIVNLINQKISGNEIYIEPNIQIIHSILEKEIIRLENYTRNLNNNLSDPTQELNSLFRRTLEEIWG